MEDQKFFLREKFHQLIEEGRVTIRNIRRDILHEIKNFGESEHISEDEIHRQETEIQTITDNNVELLNSLQGNKEKELMEF